MLYFFLFLLPLAFAQNEYQCKTNFDQLNIPHIETQSEKEFYYCFGLSHGRDRAWEMDFFKRVGEGRNAEVLGFSQLKSDLMMRLLDLPALAHSLWEKFPEDKKIFLEEYAKGVNEGFKTGKEAQEFKDLDFSPESWTPQDTLLVLLLQSFDQTRKSFIHDYEEELTKETWKKRAEVLFDEDHMPWENTILKDGEYQKKKSSPKASGIFIEKSLKLWAQFPTVFGLESGSNNWAVSANKSKTGKAILANDPHLDLKTPMFWYWINLKSPDHKVMGGSVPGVPVIASGTNGKVSWGLTNSYLNSADAFFLKDIKESDLTSIRPTVWVKLWFFKLPFVFKSFEKLINGDRILPLESEKDEKIVLKWSGYSLTPEEMFPMFDLFKVQTVSQMDELLQKIGLPSWNYVFADTKGDIGYRLVGKTYESTDKNPFGMSEISKKDLETQKYLAPENRPHVLKPKRNYVYSANNRHWPVDSHFYGGRAYSYSFRGLRIEELLLSQKQDVESFKNIQNDQQVVDARFFLGHLQKYLKASEFEGWDMVAKDSSLIVPLYRRLMDLVMEEWKVNEYALFKILKSLPVDKQKELQDIYQKAKTEVAGRTWGEIHRVKFSHMSKNEKWNFSREIPAPGDTHSVNPGTSKWNPQLSIYEQSSGASMRMIIEMDKTPKIWLALPGLNREYTKSNRETPWENWKAGKYTELEF